MDVDTDNFDEALALMEKHLPQASFVSVDLEMTGISGGPSTQVSQGDTPFDTYARCRNVVGRPYNIVQVGICLFEESSTKVGHFECRPFNVYVFPRPVEERDSAGKVLKTDPYVGLNTSSIMFLAGNGLDFNRWIRKGVSYTSPSMGRALIDLLPKEDAAPVGGAAKDDRDKPRAEATAPQDVQLISDTMDKVKAFAASGAEEMKLPSVNNFLALILRQRIAEEHPGLVVDKRPDPVNPNFQERWVMNLSEEGWRRRHAETRKKLLAHIGFNRMWGALKASKKDVIVHNGVFDLLFLLAAFEGGVPPTLPEFKALMRQQMPSVFDTKVLAETEGLSGLLDSRSALPGLARGLAGVLQKQATCTPSGQCQVSYTCPEGFCQYVSADGASGAFHTAGYDAYETGRIFAYYRSVLGADRMREYVNRIFLMPSAFELVLHENFDKCKVEGVARYVHSVDTAMITGRTLNEVMKPALEGKRRLNYRWCTGGKAFLLFVYGDSDIAPGAPGYAACARVVDDILQKQADQGRLQFCTLEEHLASQVAVVDGKRSSSAMGGESVEPPAKRQRQE